MKSNRLIRPRYISIFIFLGAAVALAGEIRQTYPDGKPKLILTTDVYGRRNGDYLEFAPGGKKILRGQYLNDLKTGKWISFDPNTGNATQSANYLKGLLDGISEKYAPSGVVTLRAVYRAGALVGPVAISDEHGRPLRLLNYPRSLFDVVAAYAKWNADPPLPTTFKIEPRSSAPYQAGVIDDAPQVQALQMTQFYRYLSGAPTILSLDPHFTDLSAHGAVVMDALKHLTHTPLKPKDMDDDFYKLAYAGCNEANIFEQTGGPQPTLCMALGLFVSDSDSDNIRVLGHRQWVLNPQVRRVGFGQSGGYISMHVFDRTPNVDWKYLPYPGEGFYPMELLDPDAAWSLSLNPRKFTVDPTYVASTLAIRMERLDENFQTAQKIDVEIISVIRYGVLPITIIFKPKVEKLTAGRYWVEFSGIKPNLDPEAPSFGYLVDLQPIAAMRASTQPSAENPLTRP